MLFDARRFGVGSGMKIAYTDESGAVIPPAQELPPEKEIQLVEGTTTWGILKSGWGIFLALAGVVSVVLDVASPSVQTSSGTISIFGNGSMTLGWLFIIGAFVLPVAILRQFCEKPCNSVVAVLWCAFLLLLWGVVHATSDPSHPARPNLALLLGGVVLCWRLLVNHRQVCGQTKDEESFVREKTALGAASVVSKANDSPAKVRLKEERQIKTLTITQPVAGNATHSPERASDLKKRILVGGLFVICAAVAIYVLNKSDPASLNWAAVLCGIWGAGIWQVPDRFFTAQKFRGLWGKIKPWAKRIAILSASLVLIAALLILFVKRSQNEDSTSSENGWEMVKLHGREYVSADSIRQFFDPVYGFTTFRVQDSHFWLGSPKLILKAQIGSDEILINNIKLFLELPVEEFNGKVFFSRLDLCKFIDPVLYPRHIQNVEKFDTVVIDASHGGQDAGARGVYGYEKDFALKMSIAVGAALKQRGFKVVMTRATDAFVSQEERVNISNATSKSILISLHFNTGEKTSTGIETIPLIPQESADATFQHGSSVALAVAVHASVVSRFKFVDLGVKCARMEDYDGCKRPGILFKGGFVSNDQECLLIASDTYRQQVSNAIADAVENYRKAVDSALDQPRK